MNKTDKLRIGVKIALAKATGRPRPFFVQYSLLNACNAKCVYCNCPHREDPRADLATHLRTLQEFARLGSIDGRESAHDGQRGKGTWKKVMSAIDACASARLDFFLSAVVTRDTIGEVGWLIDTARRYGVMVNFQIPQFNPEMYGTSARDWMPDAEDVRTLIDTIVRAKESGAPVLFTARSYRHTRDWDDFSREREERPDEASPCTAGKYFLQLEPNGDIYPCVLHIGTFRPKNAFRDGVEAAWKHASSHSCHNCYKTWLNENRGIFDLHPSILRNFWSNYLRPRR